MELKIKILTCVVIRGRGTDKVSITFEGPSPYTYTTYTETSPSMNFDVAAGYAEEWLMQAFGISPEFIEVIDLNKKAERFPRGWHPDTDF